VAVSRTPMIWRPTSLWRAAVSLRVVLESRQRPSAAPSNSGPVWHPRHRCRLADAAAQENQSHLGYLEALLAGRYGGAESRVIIRLLHEAKLPRMKTLDGFAGGGRQPDSNATFRRHKLELLMPAAVSS
jgi:hypothetical protein